MVHVPDFQIDSSRWVEGNLLYGKHLAGAIREHIAHQTAELSEKPGLAALLVGEDEASRVYVGHKEKDAAKCGFHSEVVRLPADSTQEQVLAQVHSWNTDPAIHGIIVQLPLPAHLNATEIIQAVSPEKDADGFHFINMGRLLAKEQATVACTPLGVMVMLNEAGVDLSGKHAVVLGRSNIVGKPMAQLLLDSGQCTVTVCHSRTVNINDYVEQADILISAMGVRGIVDHSRVKSGAIVIDVGMHRVDGKLKGDLDYELLTDVASLITPVPGGVGPMTRAMLMVNTLENYQRIRTNQSYLS